MLLELVVNVVEVGPQVDLGLLLLADKLLDSLDLLVHLRNPLRHSSLHVLPEAHAALDCRDIEVKLSKGELD